MHIAVTGGSGRVGTAVIQQALARGHSVVNLDRAAPKTDGGAPDVPFIQVDMADYQQVEQALRGCDGLVHLAAIPSPGHHPDHEVHNNNVVGSYNALMAAVSNGIKRICQASSINATGAAYSRWPRYDYFPIDERHPTYNEDPYSLSKWICEQQADSVVRRYEDVQIASMRFHWVVPPDFKLPQFSDPYHERWAKNLWGYTLSAAAARACVQSLSADFGGHEVFFIVAPHTAVDLPSLDLKQRFFPDVPVRGDLSDRHGFYDCSKAERLLGWAHDADE